MGNSGRSGFCAPAGCVCFLLCLFLCPAIAWPAASVLVLFDPQNDNHRLALEPLLGLNSARPAPDMAVTIRPMDYREQHLTELDTIDLVITIGVHAATRLRAARPSVATLNILIPQATYLQLNGTAATRSAAIFLDQPMERQFALARALLPTAERAGILLGRGSAADTAVLSQAADRQMFKLDVVTIDADTKPAAAIRRVLADSDFVMSVFDRETQKAGTAKWLLYLALQKRRPVIGFSRALLQAGAVAAVFSTPQQMATHTVELVTKWLETGIAPSGTIFPRYYDIGLNLPIAARLGLQPPSQKDLRVQMQKILGETP